MYGIGWPSNLEICSFIGAGRVDSRTPQSIDLVSAVQPTHPVPLCANWVTSVMHPPKLPEPRLIRFASRAALVVPRAPAQMPIAVEPSQLDNPWPEAAIVVDKAPPNSPPRRSGSLDSPSQSLPGDPPWDWD